MCKLLLIGGTGFFGKSILDASNRNILDSFGITDIIVCSRSSEKFQKNYKDLISKKVSFFDCDISTTKVLPDFDYVIHAATSSNKLDYTFNEKRELKNIKLGAKNFINLMKKKSKKIKILYCSSGAVYGQQPQNLESLKESDPLYSLESLSREKKVYALGKRVAENAIYELSEYGYKCVIARCFAFYGNYLPKNQHFAYGSFQGLAEEGKDIVVNAKNRVYRSYMHSDDLAISLISLVKFNLNNFDIYNVGSPNEILIQDLATKIAKKYNVSVISTNIDEKLAHDRYIPNTKKLEYFMKQNKLNFENYNLGIL